MSWYQSRRKFLISYILAIRDNATLVRIRSFRLEADHIKKQMNLTTTTLLILKKIITHQENTIAS